jgi:cellulose synthase (UDP-forming)
MLRFGALTQAHWARLRRRGSPAMRNSKGRTTQRALWPQHAVMGLSAVAIIAGLLQYGRSDGEGAIALLVMAAWASVNATLAGVALRHATRASTNRRCEYRFPLPIAVRLIESPASTPLALAIDISPLGCRIVGAPVASAKPGDELTGDLLLPTGPLRIVASVRALIERTEGGRVERALGCEFRWGLCDERNRLETFLFGSDLQWQLNGFSDRRFTPLEQVAAWLGRSRAHRLVGRFGRVLHDLASSRVELERFPRQ